MKGQVLWITGYAGAGKTTIARCVEDLLRARHASVVMLDGDNMREALQNFDYSEEGRLELAKIYARLAKNIADQGHVVLVATISMFREVWSWNRKNIPRYKLVYVKVDKETLWKRDQKSLYSGYAGASTRNLVGADIISVEPNDPDLVILNDGDQKPEVLAQQIVEKIFRDI